MNKKQILTLLEKRLNDYELSKSDKSFDILWSLFNLIESIDGYKVEYNLIRKKDTLYYTFYLSDCKLIKTYKTEYILEPSIIR